MKNFTNYKVALGSLLMFFFSSIAAQDAQNSNSNLDPETQERTEHYEELANLGYRDNEIFEDLGNANFLMEKYETAVFWYQKLIDLSKKNGKNVADSYLDRYQYAMAKTGAGITIITEEKDWLAAVQDDYKVTKAVPGPSLTEKLAQGYQKSNYANNNSNKALEELVRKESGHESLEDGNLAAMAPIAIA